MVLFEWRQPADDGGAVGGAGGVAHQIDQNVDPIGVDLFGSGSDPDGVQISIRLYAGFDALAPCTAIIGPMSIVSPTLPTPQLCIRR